MSVEEQRLEYIRSLFSPAIDGIEQAADHLPECEVIMQACPEDAKLLQLLVQMSGAKKIVEVGVLAGYSTVCMAKAMGDGGHIIAIEKNYKRINPPLENYRRFGVADRIELIEGLALDVLDAIKDRAPFDMIFIDADKGGYNDYLDWADKYIKKGGLIVADNTLLFDSVFDAHTRKVSERSITNMKAFNKRMSDSKKYLSLLVPTTGGMLVAIKQ